MKLSKNILIIITIAVLTGSIGLIYKSNTAVVNHKEKSNINKLNETKKLEKIDGKEILTPQQLGELAIYGSQNVQATFYKPVPVYEAKNYLEDIFSTINFNIADNLPFKSGKTESYIVEVKINNTNKINKQAHFVYLKDKNLLGNYGDEFVVISVYEMDNTIINNIFDVFKKTDKDVFGNKLEILEKDGLTFINTKITSNEALNYSYYQYDDTEKSLGINTSVVNKIITQKNGLVYDVGYYLIDSTKEKEDKVLYSLINFINSK